MDKRALMEIRAFDNGVNTPDSFNVWRHPEEVPEVCKLVFDLLLRFRAVESNEAPVDFSEIEPFVAKAVGMVEKQAETSLALAEGRISVRDVNGRIEWGAIGRGSDERAPTESEMVWFEGESRLLFDALRDQGADNDRRIFAAFGLYSCGRALAAIRAGGPSLAAISLLATAGRCLGLARAYSGWGGRDEVAREERRRGGKRPRAENPEKAIARECARENPGWSAVQIKTRARLKSSERSIRKWISEHS